MFDNYCVKGYVPEAVKTNSWLLNPSKAKKSCWQWLLSHWENLKEDEEWGENTHKYIADVKKVYKAQGTDAQGNTDKTEVTLYLDEDGKPISQLRAVVNNVSKLSEEEYNYLGEKVTHLRLLPYEYHKELMEAPFRVDTVQSANIVNEALTADENRIYLLIKRKALPSSSLVEETGFGKTKVVSILRRLMDKGYVQSVGNGRGTKYTAEAIK